MLWVCLEWTSQHRSTSWSRSLSERRTAPSRPEDSARRLAVYGSLAPGRPNYDQLAGLRGRWIEGTVRGELHQEGWGAELGFPALVLDPAGSAISVRLFESADLPAHWARLDAFEGSGYRRVATAVSTVEGELGAFIYVLARD